MSDVTHYTASNVQKELKHIGLERGRARGTLEQRSYSAARGVGVSAVVGYSRVGGRGWGDIAMVCIGVPMLQTS